jgi:coiled-coil domain-containing protein 61
MTTFDPTNQRLFIEVEEKLTGELWRGDYQSKYIEEITAKTGVPKKFIQFAKMLVLAFKGQNFEQCSIDLLTYADLEDLKSKRTGQPPNPANLNNPVNIKKRYIIMTETSGGDKVHYPLPLNYIEEPEPDALRRTLERMRS